jgi:hypothetical protein
VSRLSGGRRFGGLAAALAVTLAVAGCQSGGDIAGAATGTATTIATGNPAFGAAVGLGTRAVANATIRFAGRRWREAEQNALAAEVGGMEVGEVRSWRWESELPVGGAQGEVRVLRVTETPLTTCKEVLFGTAPQAGTAPDRWFVTSACRHQPEGDWRWAAAEPAIGRWQSLQ